MNQEKSTSDHNLANELNSAKETIDEFLNFLNNTNEPCPFCGCIPDIDDPDFCYPTSRTKEVWQAGCTVCSGIILGKTEQDAINNWNKRYEHTKTN